MRLTLISDLHYGVRDDSQLFLDNNKKFIDATFFPKIMEIDSKVIVCLGDLLHRRKHVNYNTATRLQNDLIRPMMHGGYYFHWLLGNHDIYFRETSEVNAADVLFYGGIYPYAYATDVKFEDCEILFVPWITNQNREQVMNKLATTTAQIVFGHFELDGFEETKGHNHVGGMSPDVFNRFDVVLSGHFHQQSKKGNIQYLGAHSEFQWGDDGERRGFHIFDTSTRTLEFIENPIKVFSKIYYDDAKGQPTVPLGGFKSLYNKFVKVIVSGKNDPAQYEWFLNEVEQAKPVDIKIVEDHLNLNLTGEVKMDDTQSTLQIMREYVRQANNIVNVDKLDHLVVDLYKKAMIDEQGS